MKTDEIKPMANVLSELNESYVDLLNAMKETVKEVKTTRNLWRDGNRSRLMRLGLTLILFPEPTPISDTVGACLVVAGAIQKRIRDRAIYIEDIYKTFQGALKLIGAARSQ